MEATTDSRKVVTQSGHQLASKVLNSFRKNCNNNLLLKNIFISITWLIEVHSTWALSSKKKKVPWWVF